MTNYEKPPLDYLELVAEYLVDAYDAGIFLAVDAVRRAVAAEWEFSGDSEEDGENIFDTEEFWTDTSLVSPGRFVGSVITDDEDEDE